LRECQVLPTYFQELKRELETLKDSADKTSQRVATLNQESQRLRTYRHAIPIAAQWRTAQHALSELQHVPDLAPSFNERRVAAEQQRSVANGRQTQLKQRLVTARQEIESLAGD